MDNFDYSTKPQMPQFREGNGRWDWRQMLDMVIPGNVWNSHTNQYRPLGIAQGLTGIPIDTGLGAVRNAGSFLGSIGRNLGGLFSQGSPVGRGDRTYLGPTSFGPTNAVGLMSQPGFAGRNTWGTLPTTSGRVEGWQMPGTQGGGGRGTSGLNSLPYGGFATGNAARIGSASGSGAGSGGGNARTGRIDRGRSGNATRIRGSS